MLFKCEKFPQMPRRQNTETTSNPEIRSAGHIVKPSAYPSYVGPSLQIDKFDVD
jgi:hypothetical protein